MTATATDLQSPTDQPADWWRGAVIYQIYPRSFQDSTGDGTGDLRGILQRLEHVAFLGADAIWLSPFFTSPMADFGYDVSNYKDVDPMFGTLDDFRKLVARAHELGLKVLIDLVISHTSDQHPWFKESRSSRDNAKADWYVWADSKPEGSPPNNWLSIFGGSAWEWDSVRCQYYLHNFLTSQPDLNFHTPEVQDAVLDAAQFWLDIGVDGFRLDTVNFYFHDAELRDNPPLPPGMILTGVEPTNPYAFQHHLYDKTRPENLAFLERLRGLLDRYPGTTCVGEIGADRDVIGTTAAYTAAGKRLHMAYSFDLLTEDHSPTYIRTKMEQMEAGIGSGWPSWALSNHDVVRVATRWGRDLDTSKFAPLATALLTSLRGTPCIYQGEELGLHEVDVPYEQLQDPYGIRFWPKFKGRDGCRTPMPWAPDQPNAGFTAAAPWLPIPEEHWLASVAAQMADDTSILFRTRKFLLWRKTQPALQRGSICFHPQDGNVLAFSRADGTQSILCVFNLGTEATDWTLPAEFRDHCQTMPEPGFGGTLGNNKVHLPALDAFYGSIDQRG